MKHMKKAVQFSKVMVLLAALYFVFHAGQALAFRLAESHLERTLGIMEGAILGLVAIGLIVTAVMIWNDL